MKNLFLRKIIFMLLVFSLLVAPAQADDSSYTSTSVNGHSANYVTIDMSGNVEARMMIANGVTNSAQSVTGMAKDNGAFAAVNGTYFDAYSGNPVPYGVIIRDGKMLCAGSGTGAVAGITADGRLLVDRMQPTLNVLVNGEQKVTAWRINFPSEESEAVTIFTPEFPSPVTPPEGAKTVLVDSAGQVTSIVTGSFTPPQDGFGISFNPGWIYVADQRFQVGDHVEYTVGYRTTFTDASDWENVTQAVGAGPSLIINGTVTADGEVEGFVEDKINVNRGAHSFIGATADGKILIGNIGNVTLKEAAAVCQSLSLINAMCLDGGGSVGLYYNGQKTAGRDVNNALGFFTTSGQAKPQTPPTPATPSVTAYGRSQSLLLDGNTVNLQAYNINGNNYFKLRDLAYLLNGTKAQFAVGYDTAAKAISLTGGQPYEAVGGEGVLQSERTLKVQPMQAALYINGQLQDVTAYNIDGNNYFKLRDLAQMMDFGVGYDAVSKLVSIDPESGYVE